MSEREKNTHMDIQASTDTPTHRQIAEAVDRALTLKADMSAEERHFRRSRKIRKLIYKWMWANVGRLFDTEGDMAGEAANYADCALSTAWRWINQYTRTNADFRLTEQASGYILWRRAEMAQA